MDFQFLKQLPNQSAICHKCIFSVSAHPYVADEGVVALEGDRLVLRGIVVVDGPPLGQRRNVHGAARQCASVMQNMSW